MDEITEETPDPDVDAIEEAMAHAYAIRDLLRPVLLRSSERTRVRLAVRRTRTKHDAASRERRSA